MSRMTIRRIGLGSALKAFAAIGILVSILPACVVGWAAKWLIMSFRALLEGWQNIQIASILGQSQRVNLTQLMGLEPALKTLQGWDALSWLVVLGLVALLCLVSGVLVALFGALAVLAYNLIASLTGGLEVDLSTKD